MRLVEFKDSSKDKYSKIDLDKARRPRLTLRHLNKLKSYNASKKKEELEHVSVSNNASDKSHQDRSKVILPQNNGNDCIDGISRKEQRRLEAERRNELNKKIRPLKKKLGQVEKEIENN